MNRLVIVAIVAACAKTETDRCRQLTDKLRPTMTAILREQGKPASEDLFVKMYDDCHARPATEPIPGADCILGAKDDPAVRACFEAGLKDYQTASMSTEATATLRLLGGNAKAYFVDHGGFPKGNAGPTPAQPCCGNADHKCAVTKDWESDPTWLALGLAVEEPSRFQYAYTSDGKTFTATAVGDPRCDGHPVTISATGTSANGEPSFTVVNPLVK